MSDDDNSELCVVEHPRVREIEELFTPGAEFVSSTNMRILLKEYCIYKNFELAPTDHSANIYYRCKGEKRWMPILDQGNAS